jgi:4-amino-4-deoxy-L-arabinose transferase-like glycosyltransferase
MSSVKKAQLDRTEGPAAEASPAASTPAPWLAWVRTKIPDEKTAVIATLILGALLFFPYLGTTGLWDPWETHYGEVAREMIVRDDYVYPYWESAYFFSKPALSMWLMVIGMWVVGAESPAPDQPLGEWTEWGMRMPFALIAIASLWAVYRIGRQLRSREAGLFSVVVLASSAQFIFIGKQAMVDMPTVGFLTVSLAFFIAAVFDQEEDAPANSKQKGWAIGGFSLALFPQLMAIGREMRSTTDLLPVLGAAVLGLAFVAGIALKASRRDTYLVGFYTCMGLATLAKGPVALLIVGPTVIVYMAFSGDWRILPGARC